MGKFFQVADKELEDVHLLSVNQSNLRLENGHIDNNFKRTIFPNYLLLEMIRDATFLKIRIAQINFFQATSQEYLEDIDDLLCAKKYSDIVKKIEDSDLDVKSIVFFDIEGNRIVLYSSGIVWLENEVNTKQVISNLLGKAKT